MSDVERLSSRPVFANPWLRLREDRIRFADGTEGSYAVVDKDDFVLVLPWSGDGFWLVEQYRYPVGSRQWEFPQGGWPTGRSGSAAELAEAELAEETGLRAATWTHLGRLFAAYGYSSQSYDVFLAADLTAGSPEREVTEQDMIHRRFGLDEVIAMVRDGRLADAHSVAALALWQLHTGE